MFLFRRLLITILINSLLFIFLIVGIQNSSNKKSINFLINKTIELPIGFISGTSFLAGSLLGGILTSINLSKNKKMEL
tara:strand:+ start:60 stop:293 length:234 start_codon:yes stop_codon:yes gene_type:complete